MINDTMHDKISEAQAAEDVKHCRQQSQARNTQHYWVGSQVALFLNNWP